MSWFDPFGVTDMFDSFMHPERGYEEAENQARQGWREARGYQEPFVQKGMDQYGRLNDAIGRLMNPADLENEWASKYETSPFAKRLLDMNRQSGLEAASSMGLMGSSGALGNIQQGAGDIVSRDRQQFLQDLMQKYLAGIGIGENIYGAGATAAGNLGNQAFKQGENLAGLGFGRTNARGQLFGNALGTGASLLGSWLGGGA